MTAGELLSMLGRAWSRLLIYPGGITAFGLVWLIGWVAGRRARGTAGESQEPISAGLPPAIAIGAVVLPWLGLALLPLPPAPGLPRQIDLIVLLALLEWPLVATIAYECRAHDPAGRARAARRLAAALNGYPPLILAALLLAQSSRSFDLTALARLPDAAALPSLTVLRRLGAVALALALPAVLGLGPFAAGRAAPFALRLGLRLRAIGLTALAALTWMVSLRAAAPDVLGEAAESIPPLVWLLPPLLLLVVLLWVYDRATAGRRPQGWARAYQGLDIILLLALLWAAYTALQERIQ